MHNGKDKRCNRYGDPFRGEAGNSVTDKLFEYVLDLVLDPLTGEYVEYGTLIDKYYAIVFEKLHDEETGLYLEGPLYVYDLLKNEIRNGRLVQEEI